METPNSDHTETAVQHGCSRAWQVGHSFRRLAFSIAGALIFPLIALSSIFRNFRHLRLTTSNERHTGVNTFRAIAGVSATGIAFLPDVLVYLTELGPRRSRLRYTYPLPFEETVLDVERDVRIACTIAAQPTPSERPVIIIVPGMFNTSHQSALLQIATKAYFNWRYNVVVPDMRDFGDTARACTAVTSACRAEGTDIIAIANWARQRWKCGNVYVTGFSLGANITLAAAAACADHELTACVAFCAFGDLHKLIDWLSGPMRIFDASTAFNLFYRYLMHRMCRMRGIRTLDFQSYLEQIVAPYYRLTVDDVIRQSTPNNWIADVSVPTLVVHAVDDPVVPLADALDLRRIAEAARNDYVKFLLMPRGGHYANWLLDSRATEEMLLTFFADLG